MAFPATVLVLTARIAYGADPAADPADWDDLWVSVDVRVKAGVRKSGGRGGATGTADAGSCTFTIADPDGNHTPRNPRSAYWPYVRRMTPVQLLLDAGDGDLTWFEGFISNAAPRWDKSGRTPLQTVVITAKGILHRLIKGAAALRPALLRAITAAGPVSWWPLDDGADATQAASGLASSRPLTGAQPPSFGVTAGDGLTGAPGAYVEVIADEAYVGAVSGPVGELPPAGWSFQCWTYVESVPAAEIDGSFDQAHVVRIDGAGSITRLQLAHDANNDGTQGITLYVYDATTTGPLGGFGFTVVGPYPRWVHVRIRVRQGAGNTVDINLDVDGGTDVTPSSFGGGGNPLTLGAPTTFTAGATSAISGALDDPVGILHAGVAQPMFFADPDAPSLHEAGLAYVGETVSERMARLCAEEGIAITVAAGDTPTMGPQGTDTLVAELRKGEATDAGVLFEDGFGLAYQPRSARYNADYTLDLLASDLAEPPEPVEDDQTIRNALTVKRTGGSSARYEDAESIAAETRIDQGDVEISSDTDTGLLNHASWRVKLTTVPVMRLDSLTLDLAARPTLIPTWVASGLGGRMRVASIPDDRIDDLDVFVEGASEEIGPKDWMVETTCSPALPYTVAVIEGAGAPDKPWRLDTGGSELTRDVTTTATTLRVCTTGVVPWTTDAAFPDDFPFDVDVDGEQVPVSAIAAMTAASYVGAGTPAHGNNASVAPTLPGSLSDGDLLVLVAAIRNSGTGAPVEPDNWDTLKVFGNLGLFTRRYRTGVSAPTVTFSGGVANATTSAAIIAVRDTTAVLLTDPATQLNGSAANIATPALAIARDYCLILAAAWRQDDWTGSAAPAGFTEAIDTSSTGGDDQGITLAYRIDTTAAAVAAGSFTITGGASAISRSIVVALRAGQQAFTVTRSGNGVVRAHNAGTPVRLYQPAPPAL